MFEVVVALVTLTAMEVVLGIDNIIFIAIVAGRLPKARQGSARRIGLSLAFLTRVLLLLSLNFILGLTAPVLTLPELPMLHEQGARDLSWRDLILIGGGLFLIAKSTWEIHEKLERPEESEVVAGAATNAFAKVIAQIVLLDLVFSLDSIFTAIGMVNTNPTVPGYGEVNRIWIMVAAVLISIGVMMAFAGAVSDFVSQHPTLKVLALSFLILIGVLLVAEGFDQHINKGYVYFAMAFSVAVEMLNLRLRRHESVRLHNDRLPE
jgi:predicted tellurium resistance membrane protein TerC